MAAYDMIQFALQRSETPDKATGDRAVDGCMISDRGIVQTDIKVEETLMPAITQQNFAATDPKQPLRWFQLRLRN